MLFQTNTFKKDGHYCSEYIPKEEKKGSFLFLHGFPSWKTKNQDIAELLCISGYKVYLPHHLGLGFSDGKFSFKNSISQTVDFIEQNIDADDRDNLSVLGHSWGGFLSLALAPKFRNLSVLLAPLVKFPQDDELKERMTALYNEYTSDCSNYTIESMVDEWNELKSQYNFYDDSFSISSKKMLLIHGKNDDVLSDAHALSLKEKLGDCCDINIVNDDHLLCSRRINNIKYILDWIKDNDH